MPLDNATNSYKGSYQILFFTFIANFLIEKHKRQRDVPKGAYTKILMGVIGKRKRTCIL